ncbi:MAG: SCO1664 family protein [Chloroflexales bacterium]|nr:SCO1664 family protein [Chloroflexales bacterium]
MDESQSVELSVAKVLELLAKGQMDAQGVMPYSSNYTILTSVEEGDLRALAIYKPRRGERPLWDFPRGTLCRREVAAYVVSATLGFDLVPPTVLRDGPYGVGSVQLFIDSDQESHIFTMQKEGGYDAVLRKLVLFDCLINNADRKSGHCLKSTDGRMWAIDHGIAFHYEYKLRTVVWDYVGECFAPEDAAALREFRTRLNSGDDVATMLDDLLEKAEMRALRRRLENLINGGVYPAPGPGPNCPWPPV